MQKVTPFLWFDGTAEEAMNFYVSVFKNARIIELRRRGDDGPVMSGTFEIDGQRFHAFNGGPMFKFSEAVSLFVNCETQDEVVVLHMGLYGISGYLVPAELADDSAE